MIESALAKIMATYAEWEQQLGINSSAAPKEPNIPKSDSPTAVGFFRMQAISPSFFEIGRKHLDDAAKS